MTVEAGSSLTDTGLVLFLDAQNSKSYSRNRFISYGNGITTENVTFSVQGNGTFQRVSAGTVIEGYTVATTDVVYRYVLGVNGCHYHGSSTPIPSGAHATFSCDYLVTGATTYPINSTLILFENYGGGALGGGVNVPNSAQNVWQRVSFTSGPTASAGTQAMFLYPGGCGTRLADSGILYFRNPKVEWINIDTGINNFSARNSLVPWNDLNNDQNNGTLVNGPNINLTSGLSITFDGTDDYVSGTAPLLSGNTTIEAMVKFNSLGGVYTVFTQGQSGVSFSCGMVVNGTNLRFRNSNNDHALSAPQTLATGQWYHLILSTTSSGTTGYVNAVSNGTTVQTMTFNTVATYEIGKRPGNSSEYLSANVGFLKVYNIDLTQEQVTQNFNALRGRYGI